jgi:hypothetical protein
MLSPFGIERRDPASGLLKLGSILVKIRRSGQSGEMEVWDGGRKHVIQLVHGVISKLHLDGRTTTFSSIDPAEIKRQVEYFFNLPRPHVVFFPFPVSSYSYDGICPESIVLSGVTKRRDLFNPLKLLERIPVNTLKIDYKKQQTALLRLPLSKQEAAFVQRLEISTPLPLVLWKRGLDPRHASALLIALNLLGFFEGHWEPGVLFHNSIATRLKRKIATACPDHELLGVENDTSIAAIDKAFREISLELHPDRLVGLPSQQVEEARLTFSSITNAYSRLKSSRRARPVRNADAEPIARVKIKKRPVNTWKPLASEARIALDRGELHRAKAFALKALAMSPPENVKTKMIAIIRLAAA